MLEDPLIEIMLDIPEMSLYAPLLLILQLPYSPVRPSVQLSLFTHLWCSMEQESHVEVKL